MPVCVLSIVAYSPDASVCAVDRCLLSRCQCVCCRSLPTLQMPVCVLSIVAYSPDASVCVCCRSLPTLQMPVCVLSIVAYSPDAGVCTVDRCLLSKYRCVLSTVAYSPDARDVFRTVFGSETSGMRTPFRVTISTRHQ